jgi:hypothetical protein
MSEVERFKPCEPDGVDYGFSEMHPDADGGWVRYSDYEKLEAELDTRSRELSMMDWERGKEMDRADRAVKQRDEELRERLLGLESAIDRVVHANSHRSILSRSEALKAVLDSIFEETDHA